MPCKRPIALNICLTDMQLLHVENYSILIDFSDRQTEALSDAPMRPLICVRISHLGTLPTCSTTSLICVYRTFLEQW
jgi:hypothetical protein